MKFGVLVFWLSWPVSWVYLRHGSRTRLLLIADNEFLALRGWVGVAEFSMPGGGVHRGEAPATALLREVREETGIELAQRQFSHAFSAVYSKYGLRFAYDCYVAILPNKPLIKLQRKEIADYAWLPLNTPVKGLGPELQKAIAWWKSKV